MTAAQILTIGCGYSALVSRNDEHWKEEQSNMRNRKAKKLFFNLFAIALGAAICIPSVAGAMTNHSA
ncbi:hypothetical protein [Streptomyces spongiae]|uniref:Uncharacterized protein n=1 Tax=Streptomyces spongiae TaxID=565072 RepID=A0A5N8XEM8_9ACTN|nr:hypothetical protein [Streptomyces spongiae]MPY57931.1 hypothetical protein [Streptomyces spongiae]